MMMISHLFSMKALNDELSAMNVLNRQITKCLHCNLLKHMGHIDKGCLGPGYQVYSVRPEVDILVNFCTFFSFLMFGSPVSGTP